MSATERLLTEDEAAELLRLPSARVLRLARRGEIPAVRLPGNEYRFVSSDLWAWVQSHRMVSAEGRR